MNVSKPRVIKDYDKLDPEIQEKIKLEYPYGFSDNLITFTNRDGLIVSALPFETEDKYYMVRMTVREAIKIVEEDDDFDDDGMLKEGIKEEYASKYAEMEGMEEMGDDSDDDMDDDDMDDDMDDMDDIDDVDDVEDEADDDDY
jgi:hypothetical protein